MGTRRLDLPPLRAGLATARRPGRHAVSAPGPLLDNVVRLEDGVPKRLHFTAWSVGDREITDPLTRLVKRVSVLQLVVDREDARPVAKTLGVTSEALAAQLRPYLDAGAISLYEITITRRGSGFQTRYQVDVSPARPQ